MSPKRPGLPGVQAVGAPEFRDVGIPEFQDVGNACTEQFSAVIAGRSSIGAAENCQAMASRVTVEWPLTRRQVVTAGFAAGAGFLVGCRSAGKDAAGWTFVDDRKRTVRLSKRPTRIVAYTTTAAALHQWGVTPVGVFGDSPRDCCLSGQQRQRAAGSSARGMRRKICPYIVSTSVPIAAVRPLGFYEQALAISFRDEIAEVNLC